MDVEETPLDNSSLFAWANLVGALIDSAAAAGVPAALIHDFLDRLDEANGQVLQENARGAYLATVRVHRANLASND